MATKTPVSALQETCVKHKCIPIYDLVVNGADGPNNTRIFTYRVNAFNMIEEASGTSKQLAKHNVAEKLLEKLKLFDGVVVVNGDAVPQQKPADFDAISALISKCNLNSWPLPLMEMREHYGPPHSPTFTYSCTVGQHTGEGKCSTKKGAQRRAADVVLKLIEEAVKAEETVVPEQIIEPIEMVLAKFRKLTKCTRRKIDGKKVKLRDRHRYFESFPDDKIDAARAILCGLHYYEELTAKEKVRLVLHHLEIPYEISELGRGTKNRRVVFEFTGDFDGLFTKSTEAELWPRIVDYLMNMLNINLLF